MKNLVVQAYWYFDEVTGEFAYRIKNPGEALARSPEFAAVNIHVFHPLFPQLALGADLLILHMLPDPEIHQVIQLRKRMGRPTVFEIADNFLCLGPWAPPDDPHRNPLIRQNFLRYAALCDGLQFSTAEVGKTFGFLNERHAVFENQASAAGQPRPFAKPFVFGWGGSKGHERDLARIAPVIIDFCRRHEDAIFSYMGYRPIFDRLFTAIPEGRRRFTEPGPIEAYYRFLETLHVGLAPQEDTDFNRCRSDVKFLEYAAHFTAPVLSDTAPYRAHARHGENALIFRDNSQLAETLEWLHGDLGRARDLAERAYDYATTKRMAADHVGRRAHFYETLIKFQPFIAETPALPDCAGLIAYLRRASGHWYDGRYDQADALLDELLALHPGFQLAHLWKAKTMVSQGRHGEALERFAGFRPDPVYTDLFLECLVTAAQASGNPGWRALRDRIADPALRLALTPPRGCYTETRARRILELNPFDYTAMTQLDRQLAGRPEAATERAALLDRLRYLEPEAQETPPLGAPPLGTPS